MLGIALIIASSVLLCMLSPPVAAFLAIGISTIFTGAMGANIGGVIFGMQLFPNRAKEKQQSKNIYEQSLTLFRQNQLAIQNVAEEMNSANSLTFASTILT